MSSYPPGKAAIDHILLALPQRDTGMFIDQLARALKIRWRILKFAHILNPHP
jgi:hypothetical protein